MAEDPRPTSPSKQPGGKPLSFRLATLALSCFAYLWFFFAYDLPSIAINPLKERFDITTDKLGVLYSVYDLPNTVLPIVGGIV